MMPFAPSAVRSRLGALKRGLLGAPDPQTLSRQAYDAALASCRFFRHEDLNWLATRAALEYGDGVDFLNPPREVQARFVGNSYGRSYLEGAIFLDRVFNVVQRIDPALKPATMRILDFGCGWGRMLRLLARSPQFQGAELFGCDAMDLALRICRRSVPNAFFSRTSAQPPSIYRDGLFDLVYAYSVFSHLSEAANLAWAAEFARIVRPGGMVAVTTQGRGFIEICAEYRSGARRRESSWHDNLARAFADGDALARYDAGEMLFHPSGGGDELTKDFYGEAAVPREFFRQRWGAVGLELVEWIVPEDPTAQSIAFFRR